MGHTFSNLLIHIIFSTKDRKPTIAEKYRPRLYEYLGGLARKEFGAALRIGGTSDHVHGLLVLRPDVAVAQAAQRWKSLSSGWVHRTFPEAKQFAWQVGYGAFSVSPSNRAAVLKYIGGQAVHHKKTTFEEEFLAFLKKHDIEHDPQHVFD